MLSQTLLKKIKDAAYLEGQFVTKAGNKTNYYIDKFLFVTKPDILVPLVQELTQLCPHPSEYDAIIAPALGAISIGTLLSVALDKPFIMFQKTPPGTPIEDALIGEYKPGDRVIVLEDVLSTGSTVLALGEAVKSIPLTIVKMIGVINREEGALENMEKAGYHVSCLIKKSDLHRI